MVRSSKGGGAGNKDLRQMVKEFKGRGWRVSLTGKNHLKWQHEKTGSIVFSSYTPGDGRGLKNLRAHLEKGEKTAG